MSAKADEPLDDREFPDEEDLGDSTDVLEDLMPCPQCGRAIYHDAQQCPYCRQWLVREEGLWRTSRKWYVRGGLWLTSTLLLNWLFWIGLSVLALILLLLRGRLIGRN